MLRLNCSRALLLTITIFIIVALVITGLIFVIPAAGGDEDSRSDGPWSTSFRKAAIVTNGKECSAIGRDILLKNGTIADAAIAALLCEGVACFQSMGIGGGFFLTMYKRETGEVRHLNARESAPAGAYKDMYKNDPGAASIGGLSVAVPGELRGYEELYKKYGGGVTWKELFEPTINLCRTGILITNYTANVLRTREQNIFKEESLREIFINPKTNRTWVAGDKILRLKLADTLEVVSREGADALYNGSLTDTFVKDIQKFNGIITKEDMKDYKVKWEKPIEFNLDNELKMYVSPLPGSGPVLEIVFNVLKNYLPTSLPSNTRWQRIIEAFKFTYGVRSEFGDPEFVPGIGKIMEKVRSQEFADQIRNQILDNKTFNDPAHYGAKFSHVEDHGTAHLSFIAPNGDALSVTSTINLVLGAFRRSQSTGIILNDEMDDFSMPWVKAASPANFIEPGKRPMSSMCPAIIVDKKGDVKLVVGGAGGMKITTSVILATLRNLVFNESIVDSIVAPRLHHQLDPMKVTMESGFSEDLIKSLKEKGHRIEFKNPGDGFAALTAIAKQADGRFVPFSDIRRNGSVAGID